MAYIGTQPNDVKKNTGLYTPSEILQLTKDGSWGGSYNFIAEQTASGVSTIEFTNLQEQKYDVHYLVGTVHLVGTTDTNYEYNLRVSNDGGSSYESGSNYQYAYQNCKAEATSFNERQDTSATSFRFDGVIDKTNASANFYIYIYNLGSSSIFTSLTFQDSSIISSDRRTRSRFGGEVYTVAETNNALQFTQTATNFDTGTNIKLYGVKQI